MTQTDERQRSRTNRTGGVGRIEVNETNRHDGVEWSGEEDRTEIKQRKGNRERERESEKRLQMQNHRPHRYECGTIPDDPATTILSPASLVSTQGDWCLFVLCRVASCMARSVPGTRDKLTRLRLWESHSICTLIRIVHPPPLPHPLFPLLLLLYLSSLFRIDSLLL